MDSNIMATVTFRNMNYCQIPMELFRTLVQGNNKSLDISPNMLREFMLNHMNDSEEYRSILTKSIRDLNEYMVGEC